jgi:hypothetical protein
VEKFGTKNTKKTQRNNQSMSLQNYRGKKKKKKKTSMQFSSLIIWKLLLLLLLLLSSLLLQLFNLFLLPKLPLGGKKKNKIK